MARRAEKRILGASIGHCVHVAGILRFLNLAQDHGFETRYLGPAVSVADMAKAIEEYHPDLVALSYRLTPEVFETLAQEIKDEVTNHGWHDLKFVFGGTPPVAEKARKSGLFDAVFSGLESVDAVVSYLKGQAGEGKEEGLPPQNLIERIQFKSPYPLIRHHFGLPTVAETVKGAREVALSEMLDVLSIGPDQNAQESFFRPREMKKGQDGAGGVPLRKPADLEAIYTATRCGSYPLLRCYSGTRDLERWAEMLKRTINLAWGAVPLLWYNTLDGRSNRPPLESIQENQNAIQWYASRGIPVEVNEAHHWSLREAPDTVAVAAAFLAAYNAKKLGVRHYVAQYMFNAPSKTSFPMDLAKMLAKIELIESLHDEYFISIRQTRTGLASLSSDAFVAKGQLASSTLVQMALEPGIIHVVGFCEGDHAATPMDILESVKIVEGVLRNHFPGSLMIVDDFRIQERKEELFEEAKILLEAIRTTADKTVKDPWIDAGTLAAALKSGLLDAPHLCGNPDAAGKVKTTIHDGACRAVDPESGSVLTEKERISRLPAGY
jgi:methylmalonyl-CoA mutase cobalamin-binding subunit